MLYISLTLLSMTIFFILIFKYLKDRGKKYDAQALTKLLSILMFFISIDSLYYSLLYSSEHRFLPEILFFRLSNPIMQILSKLGVFISTILVVHFLMEKRIEKIKLNEDSLGELEKLNHILEEKALELEGSQDDLQKKVEELERFNTIAKEREASMVQLIEKIEKLEKKIKKEQKKQ